MSRVVTLFPSGHAFACEPQETILTAGLRAGISLDHSCATGTCGKCRARLIAGDRALTQPHDYVFTPAERAAGWFLMCRSRPVSDLLIETQETASATEIPLQDISAKVSKIERLREDLVLLHVRSPRTNGLQFLAGQCVGLRFPDGPARSLAIASCPCDGLHLRFHVSFRSGEPFSEYVFGGLRRGQELFLHGPSGNFVFAQSSDRPLVFVAWEFGFAPIQSLIEHAVQIDSEREIALYWLSATPNGHYLSNYCRAWTDALDGFNYQLVKTAPAGARSSAAVFAAILQRHHPVRQWDWYLTLPWEQQELFRGMIGDALPYGQLRMTEPHCG